MRCSDCNGQIVDDDHEDSDAGSNVDDADSGADEAGDRSEYL